MTVDIKVIYKIYINTDSATVIYKEVNYFDDEEHKNVTSNIRKHKIVNKSIL